LLETKSVYGPITATLRDAAKGEIEIHNKYDFIDLSHVYLVWSAEKAGVRIAKGEIHGLNAPPQGSQVLALNMKEAPDSINLSFRYNGSIGDWADHGHEIIHRQLLLNAKPAKNALHPAVTGALTVLETDANLRITGLDFEYVFDKLQGTFTELKLGGADIISAPITLDIWRAPTDNDVQIKQHWLEWGVDRARPRTYEAVLKEKSKDRCVIKVSYAYSGYSNAPILKGEATWTITPDGKLTYATTVDVSERLRVVGWGNQEPQQVYLPRFGLRLEMPEGTNQVTYLGYGPMDSYVDKKNAAHKGLFDTTADEMFENHERPQENGARYGVDYAWITDQRGKGILAECGEAPISLSVSQFCNHDMVEAKHPHELPKLDTTLVHLDYKNTGIGSNSCGPVLSEKYRFDERQFTFLVSILPAFREDW